MFLIKLLENILSKIGFAKEGFVSKMFWGRNSFYRNIAHVFMFTFTFLVAISGVLNRIVFSEEVVEINDLNNNSDLLLSGRSINTLEELDPTTGGVRVKYHTVSKGETLGDISRQYNISKEALRATNVKLLGPFSEHIQVGWVLKVPNTEGILYTAKGKDTVYSLAKKFNTDAFVISEINELEAPDYKIESGQTLFIPDGELKVVSSIVGKDFKLNESHLIGAFEDPLTHPKCAGYNFYGGLNSYPGHNGVDVGMAWGCPIRSIAAGKVIYSGWENISGYTVKVDHGKGLISYYYHGNGEIWVREGQHVKQGQNLMMMGNTGNSYGTHLHLTIKLNGRIIDPEKYVPFRYNN